MIAETVTRLEDLGGLGDDWRALAETRSNAFLTPEWQRAWWRHYGEPQGFLPAITVIRGDGGALVGVLPLAVSASGRLRAARFPGANLADTLGTVAKPADERLVAASAIEALEARGPAWSALILERIAADSPLPEALAGASRRHLAAVFRSPQRLPYLDLRGLEPDGYLTRSSPSFRKRIRYLERSLRREHKVVVRSAEDPARLPADVATFFDLHLKRWVGRGGSSIERPAARGMLGEFAAAAMARGWLRLRFLEVDGEPVAAFLGWRIGERFAYYSGGFDPRWAKQSVGMLLVAITVRDAIEEGAAEFDLLLGGERYKSRFTDLHREAITVTLVPAAHPLRVAFSGEAVARSLGRRFADGPAGGTLRSLAKRLPTSSQS